jgi:hypothetical protein
VDGAAPNQTIIIPSGFYTGGLDLTNSSVIIEGEDRAATVIRARRQYTIYDEYNNIQIGSTSAIRNLTLSGTEGVAVVVAGGSPVIDGNSFSGVGLQIADGSPVVRHNRFSSEWYRSVSALDTADSFAIENNIFENTSNRTALFCVSDPANFTDSVTRIIQNNTFYGGSIYLNPTNTVSQTIVANNIVYNETRLFSGLTLSRTDGINTWLISDFPDPIVENNLVYAPFSSTPVNGLSSISVTNLIGIVPQFLDRLNGDYHLAVDSPGIDAGNEAYFSSDDYDGQVRPIDGDGDTVAVPDIGAFEYNP